MGYDEGRGERKGQCCGGHPMTVKLHHDGRQCRSDQQAMELLERNTSPGRIGEGV